MKKRILTFTIAALLASGAVFAQAADDGFLVPLDEDLSKAITAAPQGAATTVSGPSVAQGIWIEATSSNKAIIRDIATSEKSGYEYDNSHFLTNANWWFWGDIGSVHLDAEIAVWDTDKTLFQANSYADDDPKVSWTEGLQTLATFPFSWMYNANDSGIGAFNKMGFTINTPFVNTKIGYGVLKKNGMIDFKGIYYVIDRWDDQGKGFTEFSLGNDLRKIGNFTFDVTSGYSMMHGTYGMYDLARVRYGEDETSPLADVVFTFGSVSNATDLFDYTSDMENALSLYAAVSPLEKLTLEFHALMTLGTDISFDSDYLKTYTAFAGRAGWTDEKWSVRVSESYAASNVDSVWGADGQSYDDINAGKSFTQGDLFYSPFEWLSLGADEGLTLPSYDSETFTLDYSGSTTAKFSVRNEPYADVDFSGFSSVPLTLGTYGVVNLDGAVSGTHQQAVFALQEAGVELFWEPELSFLQKVKFDYALSCNYSKWTSSAGSKYKAGNSYHSVILNADIDGNFNVFTGCIYRAYSTESASNQPLGFTVGFAFNTVSLLGHPKLWAHFAYGMDPYEDNNYSLYRADDPLNKPLHRTYLLNSLDENNYNSFIRLGLIWNL